MCVIFDGDMISGLASVNLIVWSKQMIKVKQTEINTNSGKLSVKYSTSEAYLGFIVGSVVVVV